MISDSDEQALKRNLQNVEERILRACARAGRSRTDVTLIGVTKSVSSTVARKLFEIGVTHLGESRPQELWRKSADLPSDVHWHLIGHLQTNKIQRTIAIAERMHSVDRERLLEALENEGKKEGRPINVLLEINASHEASKHGFGPDDVDRLAQILNRCDHVRAHGLMTMAAWEEDPENCRPTFVLLRRTCEKLRALVDPVHPMTELSMGMSNDFEIAIEEGATMVRVGTVLFEDVRDEARRE